MCLETARSLSSISVDLQTLTFKCPLKETLTRSSPLFGRQVKHPATLASTTRVPSLLTEPITLSLTIQEAGNSAHSLP